MFCSQCGCENHNHAKFCTQCGTALVSTTPFAQKLENPPKIEQSLNIDEELSLVVGGTAYHDYFKNKWFEKDKPANLQDKYLKQVSFNLMGFLFSSLYLGYRKMYFEVAWTSALIVMLDIIVMHWTGADKNLTVPAYISFGIIANILYYNFCKKKIKKLKAMDYDIQTYKEKLVEQGGTSVAGIFIALIIVFSISFILYPLLAPDWFWQE